jgi:hypothetical protein
MAAINVEGVSGSISYNELHNPVKAAVVLQVKDGAVNYVTTVNPRSPNLFYISGRLNESRP